MKFTARLLACLTVWTFMGCLFDSGGDQVAGGGEDFPNTVQPLGKVASSDISSHTQWDQFQGIPQPPNAQAAADSLSISALLKTAAQSVDTVQDYTVERQTEQGDLQVYLRVSGGPDHNLNTKADNKVVKYQRLLTQNGDTVEWTLLSDADGDSVLWNAGDSGVVEMQYQRLSPPSKPQVSRLSLTLRARIYHRGDSSVLLSYREQDMLNNGTVVVYAAKGVHGDSSLVAGDTALVTVDQTPLPSEDAPLLASNGRYFIRLSAQSWDFKDNALLYFTLENHWRSDQILQYSLLDFTPDAPVVSGRLDIQGTFTYSLRDERGDSSNATGMFENDSIQMDLRQAGAGKTGHYRLVYDVNGALNSKDSISP